VANNGKEAYARYLSAPEGSFALILMDIMIPDMDGYETTKAIRNSSRPDAKTIPIIAMTANAFTEDVAKSHEAGMNAHIVKPIDKNLFYTILESYKNGVPPEEDNYEKDARNRIGGGFCRDFALLLSNINSPRCLHEIERHHHLQTGFHHENSCDHRQKYGP
jgi:CheY-like chemotaxis protein